MQIHRHIHATSNIVHFCFLVVVEEKVRTACIHFSFHPNLFVVCLVTWCSSNLVCACQIYVCLLGLLWEPVKGLRLTSTARQWALCWGSLSAHKTLPPWHYHPHPSPPSPLPSSTLLQLHPYHTWMTTVWRLQGSESVWKRCDCWTVCGLLCLIPSCIFSPYEAFKVPALQSQKGTLLICHTVGSGSIHTPRLTLKPDSENAQNIAFFPP